MLPWKLAEIFFLIIFILFQLMYKKIVILISS